MEFLGELTKIISIERFAHNKAACANGINPSMGEFPGSNFCVGLVVEVSAVEGTRS